MFSRADVEQYVTFIYDQSYVPPRAWESLGFTFSINSWRGRGTLREHSPQLLHAWAELADAADACGVDDFIPDAPPPLAQGRLLWKFRASSYIVSSPIVADGVVYVGAGDRHLYAVKAATGSLLCRIPTDGNRAWLNAADGIVYANAGSLHAIDAATGGLLWNYDGHLVSNSTPAIADGNVYVGGDRSVHAVDAATGYLRWRYETGGMSAPCQPSPWLRLLQLERRQSVRGGRRHRRTSVGVLASRGRV